MAEKMFAHDIGPSVVVSSAGLFTTKWNDRTDERTVQVLRAHGYPAERTKATQISAWHYGADLLVAMDRTHVRALLGRGVSIDRIRLLRTYEPHGSYAFLDVPNPYRGDQAAFEQVYRIIAASLPSLRAYVKRMASEREPSSQRT
ncbi:protein tyrosine phosphatase [Mycolicibacterium aichiense]|uniref:arsenate reductase/protein-tyrosine-phosphatase family protein n=1 Tax=Mycolicibacterium aichiense TaxID=1799 RepID=UPI003D67433C